MKTYTEHQQDDPDFGQLRRKIRISHKPRSVGSHENSRNQIAHYRRQFEPMTDKAKDQRGKKTYGKNFNYFQMLHA